MVDRSAAFADMSVVGYNQTVAVEGVVDSSVESVAVEKFAAAVELAVDNWVAAAG